MCPGSSANTGNAQKNALPTIKVVRRIFRTASSRCRRLSPRSRTCNLLSKTGTSIWPEQSRRASGPIHRGERGVLVRRLRYDLNFSYCSAHLRMRRFGSCLLVPRCFPPEHAFPRRRVGYAGVYQTAAARAAADNIYAASDAATQAVVFSPKANGMPASRR